MAHIFEYDIVTYYLTMHKKSGTFDLNEVGAQANITNKLTKLMNDLPEILEGIDGGGWDITSHSSAVHGDTFLFSFFLQRMKV